MDHEPVEAGVVRAEDVQDRSRRFASLRSAQRALSNALHPHELQRTVEQGRAVLVDLQALSLKLKDGGAAPDSGVLDAVDERLDDISQRIRDVLERIAISELRSSLPLLSSEQPETIRGLIDVVLEGDTEGDKSLRLLEYLVTLLTCEERGRRRVMVMQPLEAVPRLGVFAERNVSETDPAIAAAERMFERASEEILEEDDLGLLRDRVRRYKEELGGRILHPDVLSAAVAYNVAMSNRLADVIEGGQTLDRLAEDLLECEEDVDETAQSIFDSSEFGRVVRALRLRLAGATHDDEACANLVAGFELGALTPEDLEYFEVAEDDHAASLVCNAVALGLTVRNQPRVDEALTRLGIDATLLSAQWLREVAREMMATARKLLAAGQYVEASRLLELKTRHLGIRPQTAAAGETVTAPQSDSDEGRFRLNLPLFRAVFGLVGLGLGLLLAGAILWPEEPELRMFSKSELANLSPHLVSGHRDSRDGRTRFVGMLDAGWDDLDADARNAVASAVGRQLVTEGVEGVVLVDGFHRIQARIESGTVIELLTRPSAASETAP